MKAKQACNIIGHALEDADRDATIQVFAHLSENAAPEVAGLRAQVQAKDAQLTAQQQQINTLQQHNVALDARLPANAAALQEERRLVRKRQPAFRYLDPRGRDDDEHLVVVRAIRTGNHRGADPG